jgi:hypothetical protein
VIAIRNECVWLVTARLSCRQTPGMIRGINGMNNCVRADRAFQLLVCPRESCDSKRKRERKHQRKRMRKRKRTHKRKRTPT